MPSGTDATLGRPAEVSGVSDERSPSGRQRFLEALEVRHNAVRGFAVGFLVTAAVYLLFVVVLSGGFDLVRNLYYLGLALTMALGLGGLVTALLMALQARRLTKEL